MTLTPTEADALTRLGCPPAVLDYYNERRHEMTAIEVLERAISKLETLRDGATDGPWSVDGAGDIVAPWQPGDPTWRTMNWVVAGDGQIAVTKQDADLIVALSRAVEPMLALLSKMLDGARVTGAVHPDVLALARAIIGEENDHG